MWPYRPRRLTELLDPDEISFLLGQGIVETLRSDVTLVEPDVENKPSPGGGARKIELPEASLPLHESPFCHFFRRGRVSGKLAFPGANEECESCELRYGARILENAARSTASSTLTSARCHMGLLDFAAPVIIRGHTLATIIAGRRVESEDDRSRVTKKVGKLGKLTRAEVRSIEESGAEAVAAIRPHDEEAREILFREIERIPRADATLGETLERVAQLLAKLAEGKFALARREWEERVLTGIVTEGSELPQRRANILKWVDGAVARLQRELACDFVALFARLPEDLGSEDRPLRLLAQRGLESEERVQLRGAEAILELDPRDVAAPAESLDECVDRAMDARSSLIGSLRPKPGCPEHWKSDLTKSVFVAACREGPGLEFVVAFGGPAARENSERPEVIRDDFGFLWRSARRISERYLLAASESIRRLASAKLGRFEQAAEARKPQGPLRPQRFDGRKLLDSALQAVQERAAARGVSFDTRGLPERAMLEADRIKLGRVFQCILDFVVDIALPGDDESRPSVLISLRRDRRDRRRFHVLFDVVGRYLNADERRRLFRDTARKDSPAGKGDATQETPAGVEQPEGPISFREAQEIVSWHAGRLNVDCERGPEAENSSDGQWTGRTVISVDLPDHPPKHPRQPKKGERPGPQSDDRKRSPDNGATAGRGGRRRSRRAPRPKD